MRVIAPHEITLLSCSLAESDSVDGAAWSAQKTYKANEKVRYNHISYTSLEDGNLNNQPDRTWSGTDAKWKKGEATVPWRMLDPYVETQTVASGGNLSFCVPYNRADAFALLNMAGAKANITIYDYDEGESVWYQEEVDLLQDIFHLSLWEYNYHPLSFIANFTQTELPQVFSGKLCVEIEGADSGAAIGHVIVGKWHELGFTQYGAELGFADYSKKSVDDFGVATLIRRSYANRASLPIYLHPDQQDYVVQTLASLRSVPALWIGDNSTKGHSSWSVYGWLEDYRMVCEGPNENQLSLEIQGLI